MPNDIGIAKQCRADTIDHEDQIHSCYLKICTHVDESSQAFARPGQVNAGIPAPSEGFFPDILPAFLPFPSPPVQEEVETYGETKDQTIFEEKIEYLRQIILHIPSIDTYQSSKCRSICFTLLLPSEFIHNDSGAPYASRVYFPW